MVTFSTALKLLTLCSTNMWRRHGATQHARQLLCSITADTKRVKNTVPMRNAGSGVTGIAHRYRMRRGREITIGICQCWTKALDYRFSLMFTIHTTRTSVHTSVLYVHLLSSNANAGAHNADASSRSHNAAQAPTERLEKSATVRPLGFVIDIVTARQRERIPRVRIINITKTKTWSY